MERTSGSLAKDNFERQQSVEGNNKGSSSKSVRERERGGYHPETEVMVGRVSSTTEHGPLSNHKKQLDVAKRVLSDKIPEAKVMAEKQRFREKSMHSRTPAQDVSQPKLGREDERLKQQLQGTSSASRKDRVLPPHISTKKHSAREDKQVESVVSSSSLASASPRTFLPATTQNRPLSSPIKRNFSSSNPKPVNKSQGEQDKYGRAPSSNVNTLTNYGSPLGENYKQDKGKKGYFRQNKEMHTKQRSHNQYDRSFHRDKNRESSSYDKMVEMKVREIRNNLQKMSTESPKVLTGFGSESRRKNAGHVVEEEEDGPLVPFLPSSRCCTPPPRPTNVEKYWSDAEETEDESDVELHLMHINSVNIVLNFLKKNTDQYYVDGSKIRTQNTGDRTMQRNSNSNVNKMPSYQPHAASHFGRSKTVHPREHSQRDNRRGMSMSPDQYRGRSTMRMHRSPSRERYGHSSRSRSPSLARQLNRRDQWSRSPSRSSRISSGYRRSSHSGSRSPPAYEESSRKRVYRYRQSSPQRNERNFHRDRRSDSPPYGYKEGFHKNREYPFHMRDAEDRFRNKSQSPVFDEESAYKKRKFSPKSSQRSSYPRSPESRSRHGFSPSSQHLSPLHLDHQEPSHVRHAHGYGTPRPGSSAGFAESHGCVAKQESGLGRSSQKKVISRWQLVKQENESKLPLEFGKGAKKAPTPVRPAGWERNSLLVDNRKQQKKSINFPKSSDPFFSGIGEDFDEYQKGNRFENEKSQGQREEKDTNSSSYLAQENVSTSLMDVITLDDDEPTIDRPEDYLNASGSLSTYHQPSFVPDVHERQKLISSPKTIELSPTQEDLGVPGSSGITSGETERDDSPYQQSRSKYDQEKEDVDSTVSRGSSPGTSLRAASSEEATSSTPNVTELPSTPKDNNTDVSRTEEEKAVLTLNSAEMSTLLTLINLAKEHVATGKRLPTNLSQIMETVQGTNKSKTSVPQENQSRDKQNDTNKSKTSVPQENQSRNKQNNTNKSKISEPPKIQSKENLHVTNKSKISEPQGNPTKKNQNDTNKSKISEPQGNPTKKNQNDTNKSKISEPQGNPTKKNQNDTNKSKISESQGNQIRMKQKQQVSAGVQDTKVENEKKLKATISKNSTKDNGNSGGGESSKKDVALAANKKDTIPEAKKDEVAVKRKADDYHSRTKDNNSLQSKSKAQGNNTDDKLHDGKKNHQLPQQKNENETSQEKCKERGQSSAVGNVNETIKKKKVDHKVVANKQSNNSTKGTAVERTFAEMQSVRVELSASREVVAASKKGKCYKVEGTTTLRSSKKKQLKQAGKRILIEDSSDSDSDDSESPDDKNDTLEAKKPHTVHPLHQETIVLDHSVNTCLACKHTLKPDEFTSLSLSTGTVTMKCRNCHTYTRMEKVMSMDFNTAISIPKNVASNATCSASSKTSETSGTSADSNNKVSKKGNLMASSKGQNENTNEKGEHLDAKKDYNKEKKHSSQELKTAVQEEKAETSACKKGIDKKFMSADAENASKTASGFKNSKDDKCQRDRKDSESSSTSNKDEGPKSVNDFDSIDPSLCVFPWSSSRKRKTLYENLVVNYGTSKSSGKQQPHKRRKKSISSTKRQDDDDEDDASIHPTKSKTDKPSTTAKASIAAKSSDAVKTGDSTESAVNSEKMSSMNTQSSTTASSATTPKSTTATKFVTPQTDPKSSTTSESTMTPKSKTYQGKQNQVGIQIQTESSTSVTSVINTEPKST